MKDNFSTKPGEYAKYRPTYPKEFFPYLYSMLRGKDNAWDCGTGNGQIAAELSRNFTMVYATDISQQQLDHAVKKENIIYSLQPAENTAFENDFFDLCIIGQAIHWFDFEKFYSEVQRTARNYALVAAIGYGRIGITDELDRIISTFYNKIIGPYWDPERRYIDENYRTIPFPFMEITPPEFINTYDWTFEHLIGYLGTWSAVNHYSMIHGANPIDIIYEDLKEKWGGEKTRKVDFPFLTRIGKIRKNTK